MCGSVTNFVYDYRGTYAAFAVVGGAIGFVAGNSLGLFGAIVGGSAGAVSSDSNVSSIAIRTIVGGCVGYVGTVAAFTVVGIGVSFVPASALCVARKLLF